MSTINGRRILASTQMVFCGLAAVLLVGCASPQTKAQQQALFARPLDPGQSRIVVKRQADLLLDSHCEQLKIDGADKGRLFNSNYIVTDVKPGQHSVDIWGSSSPGCVLTSLPLTFQGVTTTAGQTVYLKTVKMGTRIKLNVLTDEQVKSEF